MSALAVMALAVGALRAEPAAEPARIAAEMTTAALTRHDDGLTITPELLRTPHLLPPGAARVGPDGRPMTELGGVQARLWLSHGRTAWSLGVGTIGYVQHAPAPWMDAGPASLAGAAPAVSVGMRYRLSRDSAFFADALGTRALPPDISGGYVSTKVGLEWKPAKSKWGFEGRALGFQLQSGYRLSLKARHDGISVYLRGQF